MSTSTTRGKSKLLIISIAVIGVIGVFLLTRNNKRVETFSGKSSDQVIEVTSTPSPTVAPTPKKTSSSSVKGSSSPDIMAVLSDFSTIALSEYGIGMSSPQKAVDDGTVNGYTISSGFTESKAEYSGFDSILAKYKLSYKSLYSSSVLKYYEGSNLSCKIGIGEDTTQSPSNFLEIACW